MMVALEEKDGAHFAEIARAHLYHRRTPCVFALDTLASRADIKHTRPRLAAS